jgi:hypothetical protein
MCNSVKIMLNKIKSILKVSDKKNTYIEKINVINHNIEQIKQVSFKDVLFKP